MGWFDKVGELAPREICEHGCRQRGSFAGHRDA